MTLYTRYMVLFLFDLLLHQYFGYFTTLMCPGVFVCISYSFVGTDSLREIIYDTLDIIGYCPILIWLIVLRDTVVMTLSHIP